MQRYQDVYYPSWDIAPMVGLDKRVLGRITSNVWVSDGKHVCELAGLEFGYVPHEIHVFGAQMCVLTHNYAFF